VIGVDTNILVRYLTQDDDIQSDLATRLIEGFSRESPGFIAQTTIVETIWVLSRRYKLSRNAIADIMEYLLKSNEFLIENSDVGYQALAAYKASNGDFSDALIAMTGLKEGCKKTFTFDTAASNIKGMQLLKSNPSEH